MSQAASASAPRGDALATEFMPISFATLRRVGVLGLDLYLYEQGQPHPILYRNRNVALSDADVDALAADDVRCLYIHSSSVDCYQRMLTASLDRFAADDDTPADGRLAILCDTAAPLLSAALQRVAFDEIITSVQRISFHLTNLLSKPDLPAQQVFAILRHDYYTYTHMVNVAAYSTLLAIGLGITQPSELESISRGAMLHDVGKLRVPAHLLCKSAPLTPSEEHLLRMHPTNGLLELRSRGPAHDWGALMMLYQHHERHDGSGYPVGIDSTEIHPQASICMIADVFDAMTCTRPYRERLSRATACDYLERHAGSLFDREMVGCWLAAVRQSD